MPQGVKSSSKGKHPPKKRTPRTETAKFTFSYEVGCRCQPCYHALYLVTLVRAVMKQQEGQR